MALHVKRGIRVAAWLIAAAAALVAGGELMLLLIEEAADLVLEATHAAFLLLFERAFGLPYARAEGFAAWASLGLLVLLMLLIVWNLTPWVKSRLSAVRRALGEMRADTGQRWRTAHWYQKGLVIIGGMTLLLVASMFI